MKTCGSGCGKEDQNLPQLERPSPSLAPFPRDCSFRQDGQSLCCAPPASEHPRGTQHQGFPGGETER